MRQFNFILAALTLGTIQTHAESFGWLFDLASKDNMARTEAQSLVWDGVPHPVSARFEKVNIIDKVWPFYLFHVVITSPGSRANADRGSYLVCFKLKPDRTEFHIITVIQNASDPPTEQEITIDKRLNKWPMSAPWKAELDLPHKIKSPGLNVLLDMCSAESNPGR